MYLVALLSVGSLIEDCSFTEAGGIMDVGCRSVVSGGLPKMRGGTLKHSEGGLAMYLTLAQGDG